MRTFKTVFFALLLSGYSSAVLADDPVIMFRPPLPAMAPGVLANETSSPQLPTNPSDHPYWTEDWSSIPEDDDGFIFKSPGYLSNSGTITSAPIKIAFGPGDMEIRNGEGTAYSFYRLSVPHYYPPRDSSGNLVTGGPMGACMVSVSPWGDGPKNIIADHMFQYTPMPTNAGTANLSLTVHNIQSLNKTIKIGLRVRCNEGLQGAAPDGFPGSAQYTQDFEISYGPN